MTKKQECNLPDFGDMAGFTSELRALQIAAAAGDTT